MDEEALESARQAVRAAPQAGGSAYLTFLELLRTGLEKAWPRIERANRQDLEAGARRGMSEAFLRRVRLGDADLRQLGALTRAVSAELLAMAGEPGATGPQASLTVRRISKPLGVIFMIYEGRPTVTVEGAILCAVTGNSVILRGGMEISATNAALARVFAQALAAARLPPGMVQIIDDPDRSKLRRLLRRDDQIDVLIPRGGPTLLDFCRRTSAIPIIAGGGGVNHLYIHRSADLNRAVACLLDSKLVDPAGCTALEMVLADDDIAAGLVDALAERSGRADTPRLTLRLPSVLAGRAAGSGRVEVQPLEDLDDGREFLDDRIALRPVHGLAAAVEHIRRYGSGHTEGIVAADAAAIEDFCRLVDTAAIVVNGSLRLHDGPAMGLGAELAISTGRLHARGPVTLGRLLTHTWIVEAHGDPGVRLSAGPGS